MAVQAVDDSQLLSLFMRGQAVSIAPAHAQGWTHVLDSGAQLALSDAAAATLAFLGVIFYSPWDGPNARVYRLCDGYTLDHVRRMLP